MTREWHAGPAQLAVYAAGRSGETDAWSVETHLAGCALCRAELAVALQAGGPSPALSLVEGSRERVLTGLVPAPARRDRRGLLWRRGRRARVVAAWLARPSAVVAVALAVVAAVALALGASTGAAADAAGSVALLWLLAPLVPLAGVALCSAGDDDPWREVLLSTPAAGLRLVLWRTAAVLAVAVPGALAAGALVQGVGGAGASSGGWPVLWLLPCLGLTAASLAAGTVVPLGRATAGAALAWCAAVVVPAVVAVGPGGLDVVAHLARAAPDPGDLPLVAGVGAQSAWAALAVVGAVLAVVNKDSYEQLPRAADRRPA